MKSIGTYARIPELEALPFDVIEQGGFRSALKNGFPHSNSATCLDES